MWDQLIQAQGDYRQRATRGRPVRRRRSRRTMPFLPGGAAEGTREGRARTNR
ncbi:hypothetical protein [Nocardioides plantarum]|uniref:Uncharacterized protein n=1 Tax=Nocardioides plantarum TaxID=29299 RepID=A0ABV5K462_9ACTN|nr:hypothetical protein [Nocardioides plantarum]